MPTISGFSRTIGCCIIPGGPIGEHVVKGDLDPDDTLISVEHIVDGDPPTRTDRTAEFSITAGKQATIENTTTVTTGDFLHVTWAKAD